MAIKKFRATLLAIAAAVLMAPAMAQAQPAPAATQGAPAADDAGAQAAPGRGAGRGAAGRAGAAAGRGGGVQAASLQDVPVPAALLGPRVERGYRVPRVLDGKPDLSGSWSNSTLTGQTRGAQYGSRLILTEDEAATIEGRNNDLIARGNAATPLEATVQEVSANPNCSGNRGTGCNYDAGWTAPGDSVMRVNGQPRASLYTTANGQVPPRLPGRQADPRDTRGSDVGEGSSEANRQGANDNPEGRGYAERCILSFGRSAGPPMFDQLYNSHYQFQLGRDTLAIWTEMVHDVRIVRIGGQHRTDGVRPYFGDSIGWWEGDTLVVETTNIPASQAFSGSWINLKVIEKFTRVSNDRMNYRFEIHDPTMWAEPWGGEYEFWRSAPPYEYACHEGNYGLENILAGARNEEAMAAGRSLEAAPVPR